MSDATTDAKSNGKRTINNMKTVSKKTLPILWLVICILNPVKYATSRLVFFTYHLVQK